ncbi:AbrB/MazE/SpoVT family DNA-binding domain-containing protein [Nitrospirillum amazonense]|uniref:AbrB/MazE/SpoVT family DNA-binding domain-containing protein n=1 Tax=Nitrospirillum amazonense TaxID=28077 RepID=UPI002DD42BE6|nr:AbrB/MazE/SpoVT family DNA-binding domain-containing protein [Nitrospirillum amazonense]MEC4593386.1 AbrB/MazE/SpoVT family DNA-binding domain-containing protein [Nitrospirillum amazonense]
MALELTITAKGQVTLKQAVLDHLGLGPGQKVGVVFLPNGRIELQPAALRPSIVRARGMLQRPGQRAISLEEMQEAIEAEAGRAVKA